MTMIGVFALLAAAQAGSALQPSAPWQVSTEAAGCRAARSFGDDRRITLAFESDPGRHEPMLLVAAPKEQLPEGIGEMTVTPDGQAPLRVHFGAFQVADSSLRLVKLFPDKAALAQLAAAADVTIGDHLPALHTGGLAAVLAAMEKCDGELLASWGGDPALYHKRQMATLLNPARWFGAFPHDAKGRGGRVLALLNIAPDGSVSGCKAVVKVEPALDAATCATAIARVRARPPQDENGQPIASYALLPVRWIKH
jgi:hypothetical protein